MYKENNVPKPRPWRLFYHLGTSDLYTKACDAGTPGDFPHSPHTWARCFASGHLDPIQGPYVPFTGTQGDLDFALNTAQLPFLDQSYLPGVQILEKKSNA